MSRLAATLAAILLFAGSSLAAEPAQDPVSVAYRTAADLFVVPSEPVNWAHCDISRTLDFERYVSAMSTFRAAWLNPANSTEYYQRRAHAILYVVGRKYVTLLTQTTFTLSNPGHPQSCRFRLLVSNQDKRGHQRPYVLASWRFDRALNDKTPWDTLDDHKFPSLAIDFRWGVEFEALAAKDPPP